MSKAMADVLRSTVLDALGFRHGFSLRGGGVSEGCYASLNLGRAVGDEPAHVEQNRRRFARALGLDPHRLFEVSQVHGAVVRRVHAAEDPTAVRVEEADALVTTAPGLSIGIRTADCMPLLMADPESRAVAAVHAGWRGLVAGVIPAAIRALLEAGGGRVEALRVAIFPHIRGDRFEVDQPTANQLAAVAHGRPVVDDSRAKPHVDLTEVARAQLDVLGIQPGCIETVSGCTLSEPTRFFSYRRDGARSGRHLAVIATGS
jgi:polyphenol oxidase